MPDTQPTTPRAILQPNPNPIRRIISFDGGPQALVSVRILRHFAETVPDVLEKTDLFAGVSFGSFAALYLARAVSRHVPAVEALDGCVRFLDDFTCATRANACGILRMMSGLGPVDLSSQVMHVFERWLGDTTLAEIVPRVLVASFDVQAWKPRLFMNFSVEAANSDLSLVDMALASSAFPMAVNTHYQPRGGALGGDGGQLVDGAVMINNPTMTALSAAFATWQQRKDDALVRDFQDMAKLRVLSLGGTVRPDPSNPWDEGSSWIRAATKLMRTGPVRNVLQMPEHSLYWGWFQWNVLHPGLFVNLMVQAPTSSVDFQTHHILGEERYRRVDPYLRPTFEAFNILFKDPATVVFRADEFAQELFDPNNPSMEARQVRFTQEWLARTWCEPDT